MLTIKGVFLSVVGAIFLILFLHYSPPVDNSIKVDKIVVKKSKRVLEIYSKDRLIKSYKISLGFNPVGKKHFQGDGKTPEGKYYINDKNPYSKFHKNLGISYPNQADKAFARKRGKSPGGAIKIHGLPNGYGWLGRIHLLWDWTAGCIALTDEEIDELYKIIKVGTPVWIKP